MTTALSLSGFLYRTLSGAEPVRALVGDRIYSVLTLEECAYPFLVYERSSITPTQSKDGSVLDRAVVRVAVVSDDYTQSVEIAEVVRETMEASDGALVEGGDAFCRSAEMTSATEGYYNDAFVQYLDFALEVEI